MLPNRFYQIKAKNLLEEPPGIDLIFGDSIYKFPQLEIEIFFKYNERHKLVKMEAMGLYFNNHDARLEEVEDPTLITLILDKNILYNKTNNMMSVTNADNIEEISILLKQFGVKNKSGVVDAEIFSSPVMRVVSNYYKSFYIEETLTCIDIISGEKYNPETKPHWFDYTKPFLLKFEAYLN